MTGFTADNVPDQSGRTFIVTGANTGIGFQVARRLAQKRARVLLACRSEGRAQAAMAAIRRDVAEADLAFLPLDQSDLASVRRAVQLAGDEPRIDVLINNAGVMMPPLTRTSDGFELQFGVNHLATFALTGLLLPKLAETQGARVVVTSSLAHRSGEIPWDDLAAEAGYSRVARYAASKLANLLFFIELDRRLRAAGSPVQALGCHPGIASTDLQRHLGLLAFLQPLFRPLLGTADNGAWPALQAATDPNAKGGAYFGPQGKGERRGPSGPAPFRSPAASDPAIARRLWDVSVTMTGVDPGLPAA